MDNGEELQEEENSLALRFIAKLEHRAGKSLKVKISTESKRVNFEVEVYVKPLFMGQYIK